MLVLINLAQTFGFKLCLRQDFLLFIKQGVAWSFSKRPQFWLRFLESLKLQEKLFIGPFEVQEGIMQHLQE
jgi:hypothetical protein